MAWYGLVAPAGVSPAVVQRVHDAAARALKDSKTAQRLIDGGTPEAYAALIKRELELRQKIPLTE